MLTQCTVENNSFVPKKLPLVRWSSGARFAHGMIARHDEPNHDSQPNAEIVVRCQPFGKGCIVLDALDSRTTRVPETVCERYFHPLRKIGDRRRIDCQRLCRARR